MDRGRPRPRFASAGPPGRLAAAISTAFHPLLLIPLTILVLTRDFRLSGLVAAATVLPLLALTIVNVRRGRWSDFDVSDRGQRTGFYYAAVPLTLLGAGALALAGASPSLIRGTAIIAGTLLSAFALSRRLKVSLHMVFACFCGFLLAREFPLATGIVVAVAAAVGWSRHVLGRHTATELVVGAVLGTTAGLLAALS